MKTKAIFSHLCATIVGACIVWSIVARPFARTQTVFDLAPKTLYLPQPSAPHIVTPDGLLARLSNINQANAEQRDELSRDLKTYISEPTGTLVARIDGHLDPPKDMATKMTILEMLGAVSSRNFTDELVLNIKEGIPDKKDPFAIYTVTHGYSDPMVTSRFSQRRRKVANAQLCALTMSTVVNYPAAAALISDGQSSSQAVVNRLRFSNDEVEQQLLVAVLRSVDGSNLAQYRIKRLLQKENFEPRRVRLQKALRILPKATMYEAPNRFPRDDPQDFNTWPDDNWR